MARQQKPAGRPHSENRANAIFLGERTYHGKPCKKCGATERYTKGSACVACLRAFSIESRQVFNASRLADQNLDFLGSETKIEDDLDFLSHPVTAPLPPPREDKINKRRSEGTPSVPPRDSKNLNPDPEPLCPQCGCGVEADHESIGGWLRRTSRWRCTICEWEDVNPAPDIAVDTDDFLG